MARRKAPKKPSVGLGGGKPLPPTPPNAKKKITEIRKRIKKNTETRKQLAAENNQLKAQVKQLRQYAPWTPRGGGKKKNTPVELVVWDPPAEEISTPTVDFNPRHRRRVIPFYLPISEPANPFDSPV